MALQLSRKYANLPDLDSAPDVYETPELTDDNSTTGRARSESTTSSYKDYDLTDNDISGISRSRLPLHEARSYFGPAIIDAQNVDFSDRVAAKRKSYKASSRRLGKNENEIHQDEDLSDNEEAESFRKKLARLKREVEEVKEIMRKQAEDGISNQEEILDQDSDVIALSQALNDLSTHKIMSNQGFSGNLTANLGKGIKADEILQQSQSPDMPATYTVTYAPIYQESHALAKAADFDNRLTILEKALGINTTQESSLGMITPQKAILPTLEKLQRQILVVSQSTPSMLDGMTRQIRNLAQEAEKHEDIRNTAKVAHRGLGAREDSSSEIEDDSDMVAKLNSLYGTLPVIEKLRPLLPSLLDRLHSLRAIHADAATTKLALDQIDKEQVEIAEEIKKWRDGLLKMEKTIKESEVTMNTNVRTMEEWVKRLEEKMTSL